MTRVIQPGLRRGRVAIPASKSMVHRYLIAAALCGRPVRVTYAGGDSADIRATRRCLAALGLGPDADAPTDASAEAVMPCGESGTTLRFFLPIVGALGRAAVFRREGRLAARPLAPFDAELAAHGMTFREEGADLHVSGKLHGGVFRLPGNVSSQFFSGLEFAFTLMDEPARYEVEGPLESAAYVALTRATLDRFRRADLPDAVAVEGDWSNAAFFLAMGVDVTGLDPDSLQGDKAIVDQLAQIRRGGGDLDVSQTPDAVPALAAAAAITPGSVTRIVNAARLRLKESDRLAATATMLGGLGADVTELPDGLVIRGRAALRGGAADACNDHRLAMAAAVAATRCAAPVTLSGAEAVNKSYPRFWDDFDTLERLPPDGTEAGAHTPIANEKNA